MSSMDAAPSSDDSLYPIAVLIDELRNEDVQVRRERGWREKREAFILLNSLSIHFCSQQILVTILVVSRAI